MNALDILCLNAGSSSLKLAVYRCGEAGQDRLLGGAVEDVGSGRAVLRLERPGGESLVRREVDADDHAAALEAALGALAAHGIDAPDAVGHRVVHGGDEHAAPARVSPELRRELEELLPLAPLHLPGNLAALDAVMRTWPGIPQVACFDTAFHRRMPERAQRFPLPERFWAAGVRRYGFHGLSCEHAVEVLEPADDQRSIVAHLGNGASLTAVRGRRSVFNTMGFTPAGGLMMGTRSGDLDPGVLLHLLQAWGMDSDAVDELVNQQSGLLGVSGSSRDMRTLLEARAVDARAHLAVGLYCDRLRMGIGALAAVLGGLDCLVFTGGIGERAATVRGEACAGLEYLGVRIDPVRNAVGDGVISPASAACEVRIISAEENRVIARQSWETLQPRPRA